MAASSSARGLFTPQGTSTMGRTSKTPVDYISPSLKRCHVVLTTPSKYQDESIRVNTSSQLMAHSDRTSKSYVGMGPRLIQC